MIFTKKQLDILRFDNNFKPRITINEGAVRSGKSRINHWLFLSHANNYKRKKFIITGATIASIRKNVLDDIQDFLGVNIQLDKNNSFRLLENVFVCFGTKDADDYKAIKGFTSYGWLGNEITETHPLALHQCMLRCSGDNARIFWDCNPSHPLHTVKIDYIDKSGDLLLNGRLNIKSWHFKLEDNAKENEGFLNPEYIESIKKTTPTGYLYDRDIEGLWVAAEGMIYKDFNPDIHFIDKIDNVNIIEYIAGVDWGFKHLGTIVACGISDIGNYYILEEISEYEKGIDYWINEAKKLKEKYHSNIIFYCDSARVDNISAFKNAGIMAKESKKDVIEGISFVATLFKENRIKIVKNKMKYFKDNIYNYLWKDGLKEEPIKENDDILDAIRYMCFTHSISRRVIKNPQISATSLGL